MADKSKERDSPEEQAAAIGVDLETMRKLIAVNPNLRGEGDSTQDVLQRMRGGSARPSEPSKDGAKREDKDIFALTQELERRYRGERQRLSAAMRALEEENRTLGGRLLCELYDEILALDPNLTSPKTQYTLKKMQAFLAEVGFSMEGLIAHQSRKA